MNDVTNIISGTRMVHHQLLTIQSTMGCEVFVMAIQVCFCIKHTSIAADAVVKVVEAVITNPLKNVAIR